MTPAAYLLFYRRRKPETLGGEDFERAIKKAESQAKADSEKKSLLESNPDIDSVIEIESTHEGASDEDVTMEVNLAIENRRPSSRRSSSSNASNKTNVIIPFDAVVVATPPYSVASSSAGEEELPKLTEIPLMKEIGDTKLATHLSSHEGRFLGKGHVLGKSPSTGFSSIDSHENDSATEN